ncbi:MAG: DNA-binding domain-containing protein [Pseudomonadota bacterium]
MSFHSEFADALNATGTAADEQLNAAWHAEAGFAVYRNSVRKARIDALRANFPSIHRMVGEDWFVAAALVYIQEHALDDVRLLLEGKAFPEFLARFEPAGAYPYLAGVARLDRAWTQAHIAADALPLSPDALAGFAGPVESLCLRPHPACRWVADVEHPIDTLWQRARSQRDESAEIDWRAEATLVTRPELQVCWASWSLAGCAFLDACEEGLCFTAACERALALDPAFDLGAMVSQLLQSGALVALDA